MSPKIFEVSVHNCNCCQEFEKHEY